MSENQMEVSLDLELDDLADAPEFVVPPVGVYTAIFNGCVGKVMGDNPGVEVSYLLQEAQELADGGEAPAPGTEVKIGCMQSNEFGQGTLKALMKPLAEATGITNLAQLSEAAKGTTVLVTLKHRHGKKGTNSEGKVYPDISNVTVL